MDLTGKRFGKWLVLERASGDKWLCECQCELHTRREVRQYSLTSGRSTSCGKCRELEYDLTGMQFGELKVLKYAGRDNKWVCQCSCGAVVEKRSKNLRNGLCSTCGNQHAMGMNKSARYAKMQSKGATENAAVARGHKYKPAGDWEVLMPVRAGYYLCRCVCGYQKEMSDSTIYNARKRGYKCRHANVIGRRFGELEVLKRLNQRECLCMCHACGKEAIILIGNLLNGTSTTCGCSKSPTYTKEQILQVVGKYVAEHSGNKPQPKELCRLLGLGETAVYENIKRYDLYDYLENNESLGEKQIFEIFREAGAKRHNREILDGLEIDVYVPNLKLGIEYNGSFWHSDQFKDKKYHQNKTLACAKKGIRLIHVFDYEWEDINKREKLEAYFNGILNRNEALYARKMKVQDEEPALVNEFFDRNHLQGHTNSPINIVLKDERNEIVAAMSFSHPRFDTRYQYEITRYCTKSGVNIIGGAEKLFKHFIDEYDPDSILTYVDLTKFTGGVYRRLGFVPAEDMITMPNYVWVDSHLKTLPRYQTQKVKLVGMGLGKEDETESGIMTRLGYYRVYDCGNLKYIWNKK